MSNMGAQLAPLSACVTRILYLSGFPQTLKTRDIQQAFAEWENVQGGFKIKWVDDTSLYIVFSDPAIAKRAYLQCIFSPPSTFESSETGKIAKLRPYDGPEAQNVIQAVNARTGHTRGHSSRASISVGGGAAGAHARLGSLMGGNRLSSVDGFGPATGNGNGNGPTQTIHIPAKSPINNNNREPSPTLPNLPTHPTLNALITSSLSSEHLPEPGVGGAPEQQGKFNANGNANPNMSMPMAAPQPRIGNPGKRMVAHSLGMRHHPSLTRSHSGDDIQAKINELQKGMHGISVTE